MHYSHHLQMPVGWGPPHTCPRLLNTHRPEGLLAVPTIISHRRCEIQLITVPFPVLHEFVQESSAFKAVQVNSALWLCGKPNISLLSDFQWWQQSLKLFRSFYHLLEPLQTTAQNASSRSPAGLAHSRARGTKAALCSLCQTKRYTWTQLGLKPPRLFLIFPLTGRAEVFEMRLSRPPFQRKLPPFRDAMSPFKALCTWNPPITSASSRLPAVKPG